MEDEVLRRKLDALMDGYRHLSMSSIAQGLALHALAKQHPEPEAVEAYFRALIETTLAAFDDDPMHSTSRDALLIEANGFLEALKRPSPAADRGPDAS